MASVLALLSLSAVAIASPALAQSGPQRPGPQPTGSARITGRVLARDNGAPVRRALVRLSGSPAGTRTTDPKLAYLQRDVQTDDDGAFSFEGLPPGSYYVSVGRTNGFLELARAKPVIVDEGRALDVRIRLERTGAIVGRIADKNGEGLLGIEVVALRRRDFRGHVTLIPDHGSRASTNDLGQFRLFNLSPGEYFVVATPVHFRREVTLTGLREPEDPENVLVMLFSEDPARWHAGSVRYTAIQATAEMPVQPAAAGGAARRGGRVFTFLLGPVVPGRYLIVAVPSPDVMYPTEHVILERLRPLAVPITLAAGETARAEVRVSR